MGWPQWVWIVLAILSLAAFFVLDGKPRDGTYNFPRHLVAIAFSAWLLWCGGFFP